jgi:hypothetical protein
LQFKESTAIELVTGVFEFHRAQDNITVTSKSCTKNVTPLLIAALKRRTGNPWKNPQMPSFLYN